jgi:XTP/dITP diphosphohydrolase
MVTSNANKAREVEAFFGGSFEVTHVTLDIPEHRSDDVGEIALGKAQFAFDKLHTPLIVDDTGFSIDVLKGFPGPFAAYVLHTIGNEGILKLMTSEENRRAHFTTAIAYADGKITKVFPGTIQGRITRTPRGNRGFGYDSIFEWEGRTLAEIPLEEKNRISHRSKALTHFRDWILEDQDLLQACNTNG